MKTTRFPLLLAVVWLLGGCATNVPVEIRKPVAGAPTLPQAITDAEANQGRPVRWGGVIASVENRANETWLEIVAKRLDAFGEPADTDVTEGRFFARNVGFLDPQIYRKDREVTVYGTLEGTQSGKVGEQSFTYPVVKVEKLYLWPLRASWRDDPWCRNFYWRSPYWYRYPYPSLWHRYWWGYPYGWWDPFWGPYTTPGYCRR